MVRVFISYRRSDVPNHVERLRTRLEKAFGKPSIFTDVQDIGPGENFLESIHKSLAVADVILVVIGPRWLELLEQRLATSRETEYTSAEIETALQHKMNVVPILVGGGQMPSPKQLPESIRELSLRNGIAIGDRTWKRDAGKLVKYLKTAEWRVDAKRGYRPRQLIFSSILAGILAWGVAGSIAYLLFSLFGEETGRYRNLLFFLAAAGAASGAVVGVSHWLLLRKSKVIIKKSVWRGLVRTWAGLSVAAGAVAFRMVQAETFENLDGLRKFVLFVGAPIAIGAFVGLLETRKLRRTDPNIRKRVALALLTIWASGNMVGMWAGAMALDKYQDVSWLHWDDVMIPESGFRGMEPEAVRDQLTTMQLECQFRWNGENLPIGEVPDGEHFEVVGCNNLGWTEPGTLIMVTVKERKR